MAHDISHDAAGPIPLTRPDPVSFARAAWFWLQLGFISFGGPAGQIAIMHTELVERRRWISEQRFLHALNFCMVLPGPEAQQLATYLGWLMHRTRGGLVAGGLFVIPSLCMLIGLSWIYVAFGTMPVVAGLFYGIKPAVVAIVVQALHRIGARALRRKWQWVVATLAFVMIFWLEVPFPAIVLAAALTGLGLARVAPEQFAMAAHSGAQRTYGPALIDDDTPCPDHARPSARRTLAVALLGGALWLLPMALLRAQWGWDHTFTQMGWFFTKASLLTFGGAYAVLPYVYQGAVSYYGWLTPTQMVDGLALGETTPGPLIMVVAFVGFLGGYGQALLGPDAPLLAGVAAACLVTWFTFFPSFLFIFLGGPLVELTHRRLNFTAPLSAITAAVVGVILNLALFFGYHVLWPRGMAVAPDFVSVAIAATAALALFRYKAHVVHVIAGSALLGLATTLLWHNPLAH